MKKIVITGSSGFIGQNLVNFFAKNYKIICVDKRNINKFSKFQFLNKNKLINKLKKIKTGEIECIFHEGANSDTTEKNLSKIYAENFKYSKDLLEVCINKKIRLIYASSASIYGVKPLSFIENKTNTDPDNHYAFSKSLFDNYVDYILKKKINSKQIVGLRYFNVYGPAEEHKGNMSSVMYKFFYQYKESHNLKLFKGHKGVANGNQRRDFIYVDDVIKVNNFFFKNKNINGIYNCGTGKAETYNKVAKLVIQNTDNMPINNYKKFINFIDMPKMLKDKYQNYTRANLKKLKNVGYKCDFVNLERGIKKYMNYLKTKESI